MKLSKLIDPRFKGILQKLSEQKLPLKTAFKLKGIIVKANEEFAKYDDLRLESLKKYSLKDDQGNMVLDSDGNATLLADVSQEFVKELNELTSLDLDLGSMKVSELGNNLNLSVEELLILDGIILDD